MLLVDLPKEVIAGHTATEYKCLIDGVVAYNTTITKKELLNGMVLPVIIPDNKTTEVIVTRHLERDGKVLKEASFSVTPTPIKADSEVLGNNLKPYFAVYETNGKKYIKVNDYSSTTRGYIKVIIHYDNKTKVIDKLINGNIFLPTMEELGYPKSAYFIAMFYQYDNGDRVYSNNYLIEQIEDGILKILDRGSNSAFGATSDDVVIESVYKDKQTGVLITNTHLDVYRGSTKITTVNHTPDTNHFVVPSSFFINNVTTTFVLVPPNGDLVSLDYLYKRDYNPNLEVVQSRDSVLTRLESEFSLPFKLQYSETNTFLDPKNGLKYMFDGSNFIVVDAITVNSHQDDIRGLVQYGNRYAAAINYYDSDILQGYDLNYAMYPSRAFGPTQILSNGDGYSPTEYYKRGSNGRFASNSFDKDVKVALVNQVGNILLITDDIALWEYNPELDKMTYLGLDPKDPLPSGIEDFNFTDNIGRPIFQDDGTLFTFDVDTREKSVVVLKNGVDVKLFVKALVLRDITILEDLDGNLFIYNPIIG